VWSCYMRSPCGRGREAVLTGWSAEAPPVALPKGVSYSVGAGTGIRHVVLQVMIFRFCVGWGQGVIGQNILAGDAEVRLAHPCCSRAPIAS
jgi:hypothetical protein